MKLYTFAIALLTISYSCQNEKAECDENIIVENEHPKKIEFPSLDSLIITGNLYEKEGDRPIIVLCHQAGFNKVEYSKIGKTLSEKGYNCLAIDQRSGGHILESFNETLLAAEEKELPIDFLDAEQDIVAAVNYASDKYQKKVILWGSSYSSTLSLHIACENENVAAVIAFSPGNYFDEDLGDLGQKLTTIQIPTFVTSSKEESMELANLVDSVNTAIPFTQYVPKSAGNHGSRALWKTDPNNEEYWDAILAFLASLPNK